MSVHRSRHPAINLVHRQCCTIQEKSAKNLRKLGTGRQYLIPCHRLYAATLPTRLGKQMVCAACPEGQGVWSVSDQAGAEKYTVKRP